MLARLTVGLLFNLKVLVILYMTGEFNALQVGQHYLLNHVTDSQIRLCHKHTKVRLVQLVNIQHLESFPPLLIISDISTLFCRFRALRYNNIQVIVLLYLLVEGRVFVLDCFVRVAYVEVENSQLVVVGYFGYLVA